MYKTRKEVDSYVRTTFAKFRPGRERDLRCLTIAKLYYNIQEYTKAEEYLQNYINVKEDNDQAHKLLGLCAKYLKKSDKALACFQRSLQLNPKQHDLLIEVCQMLLSEDNMNAHKAKQWCELAETADLREACVFDLRMKINQFDENSGSALEELINKEIQMRPKDVGCRTRLLRHYLDQQKLNNAYQYAFDVEMEMNEDFLNSVEWYSVMWLVLSRYEQQKDAKRDWNYWLLLVVCLERQVNISLANKDASAGESANLLFRYDQYLFKFSQEVDKLCANGGDRVLISQFLIHHRGQLMLHAASLFLKRELMLNRNKWTETVRTALPLLLLGYQNEVSNERQQWLKHAGKQHKTLSELWLQQAAFRCAQVGRTLLSCILDDRGGKENEAMQYNTLLGNQCTTLWETSDDLLSVARETCADSRWRRNLFPLLFTNSDQKLKDKSSFLVNSHQLQEPKYEWPSISEIENYEDDAQQLYGNSLTHQIYLCLGNDNLADVRVKFHTKLAFSVQDLGFSGVETLNQLDIESFLYAAVIQAKRTIEVERETYENYNSGNRSAAAKPRMLPYAILPTPLCTEEQAKWWQMAYKLAKNQSNHGNFSELRLQLQFGIEVVRAINNPKMDMPIVFKLGQILVTRSQGLVKHVEKMGLEERAQILYQHGLHMLKKHQRGALEPFNKFFKYPKSNITAVERSIVAAAEDAISFLGTRYFKKSQYEEFIEELSGLQLPTATYMQAEAYRKLDELNQTSRKSKSTYFDRRNECLQQTQKLLQNNEDHPLSSLITGEINRLQQSLNSSVAHNRQGRSNDSFTSPRDFHNNSSNYEDAEEDFFAENVNRSLRESKLLQLFEKRFQSLEITVNTMAKTLYTIKDEYIDSIKTKMASMGQDVATVRDDIVELKEALKKTRIASEAPSHDDASQVLDDLYIIEDALQQHSYQAPGQQQPSSTHMQNIYNGGAMAGSPFVVQPPPQQTVQASLNQVTQQRFFSPNPNGAIHAGMPQNLPGSFNSPLFNPSHNPPLGYFSPAQAQYMIATRGAHSAGPQSSMLGPSNVNFPLNLFPPTSPYIDSTSNLNFSLAAQTQLLPTVSSITANQIAQAQLLPAVSSLPTATPVTQSLVLQSTSAPTIPTIAATQGTTSQPPSVGLFNKALNNQPVEKGPPANVVITSSDPLPKPPTSGNLSTQQPTLSVTIPPQHIKPSLVQVPEICGGIGGVSSSTSVASAVSSTVKSSSSLPSVTSSTASNTFSFSFGSNTFGNFGSLQSVGSTMFGTSAITTTTVATSAPSFSFKPQIAQAIAEKAKEEVAVVTHNESNLSDANKSFGADSEVEYDPRPDFKPIIPLPDEIEVKTGEEDEEVMFCYRAKLFRHLDSEWKERGIGEIKILKNKEGYSRILMRREQTHKICANHKIIPEMIITQSEKDNKSVFWAANDFADEELRLEKFLVRFKLPETAEEFKKAFSKAKKEADEINKKLNETTQLTVSSNDTSKQSVTADQSNKLFSLSKNTAVTSFLTSTPAPSKTDECKNGTAAGNLQISTPNSITPTSAATKSLFGSISAAKKTESNGEETKVNASPFANFSFGSVSSGKTDTAASPFAKAFDSGKSNNTTISTAPGLFSSFGGGDFSALSNKTTFGTPIGLAPKETTLNKSSTSDAEDDYVPTAQFKPVIPLPDLVELNTGEENENVLFEHRAKLLRFDKDAGEWKERGLGNMKLLQAKDDVNQVRLLMRREIVHKLCCNQRLFKETKFNYMKNNQSVLTWAGQDYSEQECSTELLCVRFKTAEICKEFYDAVQKAQATFGTNIEKTSSEKKPQNETSKVDKPTKGFGDTFKPKVGSWSCDSCYLSNDTTLLYCAACDTPKDTTVAKKETNPKAVDLSTNTKFSFGFAPGIEAKSLMVTTATTATTSQTGFVFGASKATTSTTIIASATPPAPARSDNGFGDQFKPKAGSWTCDGCYVSNPGNALNCSACEAPKDKTLSEKEDSSQSMRSGILSLNPTTPSKFSFGFAVPAASQTPAGNTTVAPTTFSFGNTIKNAESSNLFGKNDGSQAFSFAPPVATSTTLGTAPAADSSVPVIGSSKFMFSMPVISATAETSKNDPPFNLDKEQFNFTFKPKSPGRVHNKSDADDGADEEVEEEENTTVFTPVIPLPDKVDVKTGEENEEVLYVHRAKLFRLIDNEWKERGVGDVKILRHKETKKLRVVMRREQILKICLNHVLNRAVGYKAKDEKTWLFIVHDFSDGENILERFSLRFKNAEIAKSFLNAVEKALDGTAEPIIEEVEASEVTKKITDEQKKLADKLCLSHEFFEESTPCTGCRGCNPDNFEFKKVPNTEIKTTVISIPLELPALKLNPKSKNDGDTASFLKPASLSTTFGNATFGVSKNKSGQMFSGFGDGSAKNSFSFTAAVNDFENKEAKQTTGSGGFLFGQAGNTNAAGGDKSIFGQASIFGGSSGEANKSSIFGGSATGSDQTFRTKNVFGGSSTGGPVFGAVKSNATSIFGGSTAATTTTAGSIFGGAAATTVASIFGGGAAVKTTTTASSIFGGSAAATAATTTATSIFGGSAVATTTTPDSTFGGGGVSSTKCDGGLIFGSPVTSTTTTGNTLFGANNDFVSKSFSNSAITSATTVAGSPFPLTTRSTSTTTSSSVFGVGTGIKPVFSTKTPIFGGINPFSSNSGNTIFGGSFKYDTLNENQMVNVFADSGNKSSFADLSAKADDFASLASKADTKETNSTLDFSNLASKTDSADDASLASNAGTKETNATLDFSNLTSKAANADDFASLAAKAGGDASNGFQKTPTSGDYIGLTHQDAFQSFSIKSNNVSTNLSLNDSTKRDDNSTAADDDESYDPHYDPIIELPKEIVVTTGEEEETKLFGDRATLFRYNTETKEWKERGVGEIKILLHPVKKTCRMVMRREQIHKLVLNVSVGKDFCVSQMNNNPKAYMWGGMNFAEKAEGEVERLAVRFKKQEQADLFRTTLEKAIDDVKPQAD